MSNNLSKCSNPTRLAQDQKLAKNQVQDEQKYTISSDDLQKSTSESQIDGSGNVKLTDVEFTDDEGEGLHKQKANRGSMSEEVHDWKEWFSQMAFYRFGMVYMFFRLYCNVSSTMISFYIASVLKFTDPDSDEVKVPIQVALIPLSLYIMSVLTSASLSKFYQLLGKKITLSFGTLLCLLSSSALIFLNEDNSYFMYGISPFIGIAQAITLNTGITLISDVIGLKGSSGAFVFGAYSFLDKISSGIVLFFCSYGDVLDDENLVRWLTVLVYLISYYFSIFLYLIFCNFTYMIYYQYFEIIQYQLIFNKIQCLYLQYHVLQVVYQLQRLQQKSRMKILMLKRKMINVQNLWQMNWLLDLFHICFIYIYIQIQLMQNSLFRFDNKPSKQFPLDNKVWKLQEHCTFNEEPLLTEESDYSYQNDVKRIFSDSKYQQYTNSMIINNYTVHSISQVSNNQIDSELVLSTYQLFLSIQISLLQILNSKYTILIQGLKIYVYIQFHIIIMFKLNINIFIICQYFQNKFQCSEYINNLWDKYQLKSAF